MTRSLSSGSLQTSLTASVKNVLSPISAQPSGSLTFSKQLTFTDGIDAGQANRIWEWLGTLKSGSGITIDLSTFTGFDFGAGDGKDVLGQENSLTEIVAIAISNENANTSANPLEITPHSSSGWIPIGSHTVATGGALTGQGQLIKCNPAAGSFAVGGTSKNLRLFAPNGNVDYRIALIGRNDSEESSSSENSSSSSSYSSSSSSSSSSSKNSSSSSSSLSSNSSSSQS